MSIEAMKQALEAFALLDALWYQSANMNPRVVERKMYAAREALRTAIEQAEKQEPVAWRSPNWGHSADEWVYRDADDPVLGADGKPSTSNEPLYATPPAAPVQESMPDDLIATYEKGFRDGAAQRQLTDVKSWVSLTDEEIFETHKQVDSMQYLTFARAIEAKLREKNGGNHG